MSASNDALTVAAASERPSSGLARAERLAPWLAGLLFALPVLLAHYPPMTDLPLHEAVVSLLRHFGDATFTGNLYQLNLGHPNQLFSLLAAALSFVVSTTTACKITVAIALVAVPVCASRFAAHLGAPRWAAMLIAPLGLGWMFYWGLLANLFGLAVLLATLPALDRYGAEPTRAGFLRILGAFVLLFLAHESSLVVACGVVLLLAILHPLSWKKTALRVLPVAIALSLAVLEIVVAGKNPVTEAIPTLWGSTVHRVMIIPGLVSAGFEMWVRHSIFGLALGGVLMLALHRFRRRKEAAPWRQRLLDNRFEIAAAFLLVAYFAFPGTLNGATLVYHRFLAPAWAIGVVALARRDEQSAPSHRLAPFVACAAPFAALGVSLPIFFDADRVYRDLDEVIASMEVGKTIIAVHEGPTPPNRLFTPATATGHVVAMRGGRSFFDYTLSPIAAVYLKRPYHLTYTYTRLREQTHKVRPAVDFQRFKYVLFHTHSDMWAAGAVLGLQPEARLVAHKGEWYLFESTLPQLPLDAPDADLVRPYPKTSHTRIIEELKKLEGQNIELVVPMGKDTPDAP